MDKLKSRAQIETEDGSHTFRHPVHQETYHSTFGAKTESYCVFLQNSGVLDRLQSGTATRVLEIGFGTGLNFLLTAETAQSTDCSLDYVSVEIDPLEGGDLCQILSANFPHQQALVEQSIAAVDTFSKLAKSPAPSSDRPNCIEMTEHINFQLMIGDARATEFGVAGFDAVYLDAFSPKNNPDLWSAHFLRKINTAMKRDARLATYCVSREFKDALTEAKYDWWKVEGPPGKREVLIAKPL